MRKNILITGAAGFIGYHLSNRLLADGHNIIGLDNFNDYYDPSLKEARFKNLEKVAKEKCSNLFFFRVDIENKKVIEEIFKKHKPNIVVNLAAQAGVRYSIENPSAYIQSNIVGFANILENCRVNNIEHLVYASSSSVYGGNTSFPFSESDPVNHPISLYAATKKSNELMAHCYSDLFGIPTTGLRFFTVYGPWGRPDMALFKFTKAIFEEKPIDIYNNGDMIRDFTYIDDIAESIFLLINKIATKDPLFDKSNPNPATSWAPYKVFNIGNSKAINLMDYISALEKHIGKKAIKNFMPMQPGDVKKTLSNCSLLEQWIKFKPKTSLDKGVGNFLKWYKDFYKV